MFGGPTTHINACSEVGFETTTSSSLNFLRPPALRLRVDHTVHEAGHWPEDEAKRRPFLHIPTMQRNGRFQWHPWVCLPRRFLRRRFGLVRQPSDQPACPLQSESETDVHARLHNDIFKLSLPGPKSGGNARPLCTAWSRLPLLLLLQQAGLCKGAIDVKVGSDPITGPGAHRAKSYGCTQNNSSPALYLTKSYGKAAQRSYKRAILRAAAAGDHTTTYRGRRFHVRPQVARDYALQVPRAVQRSSGGHRQGALTGQRLRILSHNVGGIDAVAYDSLMNWLKTDRCDVLLADTSWLGARVEQMDDSRPACYHVGLRF